MEYALDYLVNLVVKPQCYSADSICFNASVYFDIC